jgi:hypothetical protein
MSGELEEQAATWWAGRVVDDDLKVEASALYSFPVENTVDAEQVASMYLFGGFRAFASGAPVSEDRRPPKSLWISVKRESHLLCCTKDRKYAKLRQQLTATGAQSNTVLVGCITSVVAAELGVTAGMVTSLVAVALALLFTVGKESLCGYFASG